MICEKPLAIGSAEAEELISAADSAGRVATVPFVYRFHPVVREARARVQDGSLGPARLIHGGYLQDWLASAEDDNWRIDAELGGPSRAFADIGSHWCDLVEFITGDRIDAICAQTSTVFAERADRGVARAFEAATDNGGRRRAVTTEDAVTALFRTATGVHGTLIVSQVSPGRKNHLHLEIACAEASVRFEQERPETLWLGRREGTETVWRDPDDAEPRRRAARGRPGRAPAGLPGLLRPVRGRQLRRRRGWSTRRPADVRRRGQERPAHRRGARFGGVGRLGGGLMAPLLEMRDIRKSFLGMEVLHGVGLDCNAGEIHAVVGENGAGKSTLMKVLAGVHPPDAGEVLIDGQAVSFSHPVQAQAAGVAIIYQEFNLLPDRTVAENVFVNREPTRHGWVDIRAMERRTEELLEEVGEVSFGPRTLVRNLSTAQQQVVEIVKALSLDARILVLDEPTAALAEHEVEVLFTLLRRLRERGLGMLYISHRLREIFSICDRITVLKDGELVATLPTAEVDTGKLISLMVGRELDGYFPPRGTSRGARRRPPQGHRGERRRCCRTSSLEVRAGEIVGLAGLQGSGRTELARALFGADPMPAGSGRGRRQARRAHARAAASTPAWASSPRTASSRASRSPSRSATTRCSRCARSAASSAGGSRTRSRCRSWPARWSCARARSSRRRASCPAATSRRSCSPSGSRSSPAC